jgi:predicted dehydrogenase
MLRLAIIGAGWAGERQVQAIQELGRKVTIACLVDNDRDFLQKKAQELQIAKIYTDYHEALNDPDIDAVSICTPHNLHCRMALSAAEAGKHILCEKPIATTVDDATKMIAAAEANGVKLYVAENWRYTPSAHFLRKIIETGQYIGNLVDVSATFGFQAKNFGYPGRRDWLTLPEKGGGGTWMLHGVHTVAQIRHIFGEVTSVYAQESRAVSNERPDIEATMRVLMRMESGVSLSLLQTSEVKLEHTLSGYTIHGDSGSIRAYAEGCDIYVAENNWRPEYIAYPAADWSDYAQEVEAFVDYVVDDIEGLTTARSERRSLAVVQAGYESLKTGQPVHLKERFGDL